MRGEKLETLPSNFPVSQEIHLTVPADAEGTRSRPYVSAFVS